MMISAETLIARRSALIAEGRTDWGIACAIAKEQGASPRAVESRLARMVKEGNLERNPNRQAKHGIGFDLAGTRAKLMEEGLSDGAIARAASGESGRSIGSLKTAISKLVADEIIPANPNNQKETTAEEYRWLNRRSGELAGLGLNSRSISNVLACECEKSPEAIRRILWELNGEAEGTDLLRKATREIERIIIARARLMNEGKDDREIALELAAGLGRRPETVRLIIIRAVEKGGCLKNPN
jgi:hypothetical protein